MNQIDHDHAEFAIVTIVCDDQVTVKVMNCLPHIYATYKVVKVNEEEENIVLQVLGEFVCVRLWGRIFSAGRLLNSKRLRGKC